MPRNVSGALFAWLLSLLTAALPLAAQASSDLSITMSDDPDPVLDGGQVTYTITVANGGPDAAQGLQLLDSFPPGGTFVSVTSPAGWTCPDPPPGGTSLSCTAPSMASGTSVTFTLVLDFPFFGGGSSFTNRAGISSSGTSDPAPGNNSAMATTTVQPWADLSVLVTDAPDPVEAGAGLTYTITVSNAGPDSVDALGFSDALPAGTTFSGLIAPVEWSCTTPAIGAGGSVSCTGPLSDSATLTLLTRVDRGIPTGTVLSNTATVSSDLFDPTTSDHSFTETTTVSGVTSPATLSATKTVSGDFSPGGRVTYMIVLHNSGPDTQLDNPGPELQDMLGVDLTSVSVNATSGTVQFDPVDNTILWNGSIPAGGSVTFTIQATINPAARRGVVIFNQALLFYDADGDGTNETVGATDDPSVGGTADPTLFTIGQAPIGIPTLDEAGLMLLAMVLAAMGCRVLLRRSPP